MILHNVPCLQEGCTRRFTDKDQLNGHMKKEHLLSFIRVSYFYLLRFKHI